MGTTAIGSNEYSYYHYPPPTITMTCGYTNPSHPQLCEVRSSSLPKARDTTICAVIKPDKPLIAHSFSFPGPWTLSKGVDVDHAVQDPSYATGERISSNRWDNILKQATGPDTFRTLNKGEFLYLRDWLLC